MQETWVWSLGWEDPLEKEMATYCSILAWRVPWTEEPGAGGPQSMGLQRVRHNSATEQQQGRSVGFLCVRFSLCLAFHAPYPRVKFFNMREVYLRVLANCARGMGFPVCLFLTHGNTGLRISFWFSTEHYVPKITHPAVCTVPNGGVTHTVGHAVLGPPPALRSLAPFLLLWLPSGRHMARHTVHSAKWAWWHFFKGLCFFFF